MIEYVEMLEQLGSPINNQIAVDRILHSLHDGFGQFRVYFNMQGLGSDLHALHGLLVQADKGQSIGPHVLNMIEYVEMLEQLGSPINNQIAVDRILHSLHDGFGQFHICSVVYLGV